MNGNTLMILDATMTCCCLAPVGDFEAAEGEETWMEEEGNINSNDR